ISSPVPPSSATCRPVGSKTPQTPCDSPARAASSPIPSLSTTCNHPPADWIDMPLLYTDPRFLLHETGRHPESPERLRHLHQRLADSELAAQFERPECVAAPIEQLLPVHERGYIEQIRTAAEHGGGQVEADTVMSAQSFD